MARKAEVAEWVENLLEVDWCKRHDWFDFLSLSFDKRGIAGDIMNQMSPSDLLMGKSTGKPPPAVIALPDRPRGGRQRTIDEAFAASASAVARRRLS